MNIQTTAEEWRPIPSWPEYEVSSIGRVRRVVAGQGAKAGRVLKPWISVGYQYVALWRANKQTRVAVHRLVALTFLPAPADDQTQVAHCDGDRLNNLPTNLRWASPTENAADRAEHGTGAAGEANPMALLSEDQAREIKARTSSADRDVAREFGVCRQTVSDIQAGRRWKHLQESA